MLKQKKILWGYLLNSNNPAIVNAIMKNHNIGFSAIMTIKPIPTEIKRPKP